MHNGLIYYFYALFLSQVLPISYLMPRMLLKRVQYVVREYPPDATRGSIRCRSPRPGGRSATTAG